MSLGHGRAERDDGDDSSDDDDEEEETRQTGAVHKNVKDVDNILVV